MSKNLGNIPLPKNMTEEQQQTFTNGWNRGRKAELKRIIALLELHRSNECGFGVTHDLVELLRKNSK